MPPFVSSLENGFVGWLQWRAGGHRRWSKLQGSFAAFLVLGIELSLAHTVHSGLVIVARFVFLAAAANEGIDSHETARIGCSMAAQAVFLPLLLYFLRAPSLHALCTFRRPSLAVGLLFVAEIFAMISGYRVEQWRRVGAIRCIGAMVVTPVCEELYFRVAMFHICVNRLGSCVASSVLATAIFVAAHQTPNWQGWFVLNSAGMALGLRFVSSGGNLVDVVCLHALHNAATLAGQAAVGEITPQSERSCTWFNFAPVLFFGTMVLIESVSLASVTVSKNTVGISDSCARSFLWSKTPSSQPGRQRPNQSSPFSSGIRG